MVTRNPSKLASQYIGGITHAHTVLSNHPGHRESDLTVDRIVQTLRAAGLAGEDTSPLRYIMLNEHPSDPTYPRRLSRLSLRGQRLLKQRRRPVIGRVPILYGLEVSLLPSGGTDLTPRLADHCELVIASRHGLPRQTDVTATAVTKTLLEACHNPAIGVLGHPARFIEDLVEVDWSQIFQTAKLTGTAVEINLNTIPRPHTHPSHQAFWSQWMSWLANSQAWILIGTDLHNQLQLDTIVAEWHNLGSGISQSDNHLAHCLQLVANSGIDASRVISADYQHFTEWLALDKPARARLH